MAAPSNPHTTSAGVIVGFTSEPLFLEAVIKTEKVGQREAQVLEHEVRAAAAGKKWRVLVNMQEVTVLASMGLGALVTLHKLCQEQGGRLVVCSLRPDIAQVLKITHLDKILKIVADRDAAKKLLS